MQEEVKKEIESIVEAIKGAIPVEKIYLFGSYAYGTPTKDSDYDFYVVLPDNAGIRVLDAKIKARKSLRILNSEKDVDILASYKQDFEQRAKLNTIQRKILKEGIRLYG